MTEEPDRVCDATDEVRDRTRSVNPLRSDVASSNEGYSGFGVGAAAPRRGAPDRFLSALIGLVDGPRRGPLLLGTLISLPIIVAQIKLIGQHWYPGGDMAQAELHVRGFWANPPLVGAAGRIADESGVQGSHPGPSLWLAMWPVYGLLGSTSRGLMISVGVVHVVSVVALLWLARRRGGTSLMVLVALGTALLIRASGSDFATEPWNPWLAVVPFAVFVLLSWSLVEGEYWAWPLAVLVGSHCIQCHAGYALVVLAILGAATVVAVMQLVRASTQRKLLAGPPGSLGADNRSGVSRPAFNWASMRWLVAAVGGGLLIWAPPLIDQWRRKPGNISILVDHFGSPNEPYIGRRQALEIIVNQFNLAGPWTQGREALTVNAIGFLGLFVVWTAAIWLAIRARHHAALRLHLLLGAGVFAGSISALRLFGGYFEYTVRWWWVLAALVVTTSLWTMWSSNTGRAWPDGSGRAPGLVLVVALVAVPLVGAAQFSERAKLPGPAETKIVGGLSQELVAELHARNDPTVSRREPPKYLVRWFDPHYLGSSAFGLVLELERQGIEVGVDPEYGAAALPHRVLDEAEAEGVLYLVVGERIERVRQQGSAVELASFDIRSSVDAARSQAVRSTLVKRFAEVGRPELVDLLDMQYGLTSLIFSSTPLPDDITALVVEYLDLGQPAAVFLVPSGTSLDAVPELARATG